MFLSSRSRGFTLIELLVVISVIGMLSSVVLASVAETRDRARIAAALTFDNHLYHVWGADVYARLTFDSMAETSPGCGSIPVDSALGTATGGACGVTVSNDTPVREHKSMKFGNMANNGMSVSFGKPHKLDSYTVSAWVKPASTGGVILSATCSNDFGQCPNNRDPNNNGSYRDLFSISYYPVGGSAQLSIRYDSPPGYFGGYLTAPTIPLDKWSLVTLSYSGVAQNKFMLYIDGRPIGQPQNGYSGAQLPVDGYIDGVGMGGWSPSTQTLYNVSAYPYTIEN